MGIVQQFPKISYELVNFPASSGFKSVARPGLTSLVADLFHPPNLPIHQAHLDAVRVVSGAGENIADDALGQEPAGLVLLHYDAHPCAAPDLVP